MTETRVDWKALGIVAGYGAAGFAVAGLLATRIPVGTTATLVTLLFVQGAIGGAALGLGLKRRDLAILLAIAQGAVLAGFTFLLLPSITSALARALLFGLIGGAILGLPLRTWQGVATMAGASVAGRFVSYLALPGITNYTVAVIAFAIVMGGSLGAGLAFASQQGWIRSEPPARGEEMAPTANP